MQAFQCKKDTRVYNSEGLGSMGFGIPAAIGGCIASNKPTICIDGDGGFVMNIQELELVYRYNLPIKFFILNNNGYGSIRTTQTTHFSNNLVACDPSCGLTLPSIKLNAQAYKIPYTLIKDQTNLKKQIQDVLAIPGPVICELIVTPDHKTAPKASVYKKADGSFSARPMEDLAPFLPRKEFLENLKIEPISYE
jgi:acetolactate synthase-1/2/3 large subunit